MKRPASCLGPLLPPVFLFLLLTGCWQQKPSPMLATVALVNDEPITFQELQMELSESNEKGTQGLEATEQEKEALKRRLLEQLIERKMLLQEAKRLKIDLKEGEMQERLAEIRDNMDEEAFLRFLAERRLTKEAWENTARETLLIEKLLNQLVGDQISLPDDELMQYYNGHLEEWHLPEQVKLRQVLVPTEDEAKTLHGTLAAGADFNETARTHASSEFGEGGDLGYRTAAELPVEFEPLFKAEVGFVSDIIKSPFGYHIVKVEDRQPARTLPFDDVKERIYQTLLEEKREVLFSRWFDNIRRKTEVKINEELLHKFS
ncbi:MAG: SurA N-terminal domain-containing protein [Nitrospirae bacterium]|nr:SurA N-terminal domain-containing protein [Candidatus Manganitrophaceae bacterium]